MSTERCSYFAHLVNSQGRPTNHNGSLRERLICCHKLLQLINHQCARVLQVQEQSGRHILFLQKVRQLLQRGHRLPIILRAEMRPKESFDTIEALFILEFFTPLDAAPLCSAVAVHGVYDARGCP